jgi:hypothetical protein
MRKFPNRDRSEPMHGVSRFFAIASRLLTIAVVTILSLVVACHALSEDLEITGDVRVRLRHVDSKASGPLQGTYGEFLTRGFSLRHRFVLEAVYPVATAVRVGGMIRISNEDEEVLLAGPEYLSSDVGSAFIAYETPTLMSRLGYYSVAYTSLSLMRWDVKDDPEGGGVGCPVCPGTAGVGGAILGETLEELGPELTFEGLKVDVSAGESFGFHTFLARPRMAGDDYQILTFGGRASLAKYLRRTSSFLDLAVMAVRSEEDTKPTEGAGRIGGIPFENSVYGISWKIPLLRGLSLDGEWTRTKSHDDDPLTGSPRTRKGRGGIGSINLDIRRKLRFETSYIHLSPNWDSYFRALSYNPDREGMRIRVEFDNRPLLIALFAKYLRTVDTLPQESGKRLTYPTLSARGYLTIRPGINVGAAAIYSGEGTTDDVFTLSVDTRRVTYLGALTVEFGKDSSLTIEERYIQNRSDTEDDYDVSYLSAYVRAAIW